MSEDGGAASLRRGDRSDGQCSISDMARLYDVSLRTLRFYEDRGLLAPRREGTARFYDANDRIRLQLILKGKTTWIHARGNSGSNRIPVQVRALDRGER